MKAVVVGGGVAGPATAMALQQVGIEAVVLEARERAATEAGSYLTIAPNGLDALAVIGCLDLVRDLGFESRRSTMVGATGRLLGSVTLGTPLADGTPALTMKRPHLSRALMDEAVRRGIEVRYGARVGTVTADGPRVRAALDGRPAWAGSGAGPGTGVGSESGVGEDSGTGGGAVEGDLLVGASGVHSLVRAAVDPAAPAARYVGLTNFGGITRHTPLARELPTDGWRFVFGRRAFVGLHRTPQDDVVWFVNVPEPEIDRDRRAGTSLDQWRSRLADLVADDVGPARALIAAGELELAGDNTYDLGHVASWHRGRVVVIGDAAHAPSPSSGQGVSLALEDAVVLAGCLAGCARDGAEGSDGTDGAGVPAAYGRFVEARRARVEKVVAVGARSSSAKLPGRVGRVPMEAMMRVVFRLLVTDRSQDWITGYRVSQTPQGRVVRAASGAPAPGRPRRP